MATSTKVKQEAEQTVKTVEKDIQQPEKFFTKVNNDWVFNQAGALAYSLLMSIFPIAIAILSIFGFFLGSLGPRAQSEFITGLTHVLPSQSGISNAVVKQISTQLARDAGVWGIIAVILALFSGSRLFVQLEGFLDFIYHRPERGTLKQNGMAFLMLLLFVILIPIMTAAATGPTLIFTLLKSTPVGQIPEIATVLSILGGLVAAFIFFLGIYIVVPNQHISVRTSWLGALGAAVALQLYLTLFPLYVAHFLNTYAGPISLVILLVFFYYFAIILLLGAEVNAFFLEKVTKTPTDPVTMMYLTTSQLPKSGPEKQRQAAQGYKDKPISDQAQKAGLVNVPAADNQDVHRIQARKPDGDRTSAPSTSTQHGHLQQTQQDQHDHHDQHKPVQEKKEQAQTATSKKAIVAEAVVGTGLAFLVELWRMRQKRP